jgi:hypothetical protein
MGNSEYIIIALIYINLLIQLRIVIKYFYPFCEDLLLNKKKRWNANHDLLFSVSYIILFGTSLFLSRSILTNSQEIYYVILIGILLIGITVMLFLFYKKWLSITKPADVKSINNEKIESSYDFKITHSKTELEKIFDKLSDNNFIELVDCSENLLDKELFIETLNKGKLPDKVLFKLNMNNIQTGYFFKQLKNNSNELTLEKFMKIFKNKNPNATPSSITSSKSKSKTVNIDKQTEILESIFKS